VPELAPLIRGGGCARSRDQLPTSVAPGGTPACSTPLQRAAPTCGRPDKALKLFGFQLLAKGAWPLNRVDSLDYPSTPGLHFRWIGSNRGLSVGGRMAGPLSVLLGRNGSLVPWLLIQVRLQSQHTTPVRPGSTAPSRDIRGMRISRDGVPIRVTAAGNQALVGSTALTGHPWVIPVVACDRCHESKGRGEGDRSMCGADRI
jgi:hypothetical protein